MKIIILIPIYNDWQSVKKLLEKINHEVKGMDHSFSITLVNDASTEQFTENFSNLSNLNSIQVINLKNNVGHTRCIATGLKYINENQQFDYIIPMDGDGEDRPEEIKLFVENFNYHPNKTIVGERVKRSENILFKICYFFHKILTYTFTGQSIKFGNYTCLTKSTIEKMLSDKATWSSFSGSLAKNCNDKATISSVRGKRYFGPSKMSFYNLIKHSLSIISVFRKTFLIRSALFIIVYILFIKSNASVITALPLVFLLIAVYAISNLALRENMEEFDKSLSNINNIENLK